MLRALAQINNPVSVFVLWANDERSRISAVALEVTSYPLHERVLYAFTGDASDPLRASGRLQKMMHVSPFHPFPDNTVCHFCDAEVRIRRARRLSDDGETPPVPFESLRLSLRLFDGDTIVSTDGGTADALTDAISPSAVIHSASLVLGRPRWGRPSLLPIGLRTSFLILRQAARIGATNGRKLYEHDAANVADQRRLRHDASRVPRHWPRDGRHTPRQPGRRQCGPHAAWSGRSLAPPVRDALLAATTIAATLQT